MPPALIDIDVLIVKYKFASTASPGDGRALVKLYISRTELSPAGQLLAGGTGYKVCRELHYSSAVLQCVLLTLSPCQWHERRRVSQLARLELTIFLLAGRSGLLPCLLTLY